MHTNFRVVYLFQLKIHDAHTFIDKSMNDDTQQSLDFNANLSELLPMMLTWFSFYLCVFFLFCKSNFSFASLCLHFYVFHEPEKKFTRCDNFNLFATIRSRQEEKHYFCCLFSIVLFRMCVKILIGHTFSLFFSPFNSTSIPQHENTHSWCHLPKWQKQNKTKAKKKNSDAHSTWYSIFES